MIPSRASISSSHSILLIISKYIESMTRRFGFKNSLASFYSNKLSRAIAAITYIGKNYLFYIDTETP